jgi:F0F1-type ATP synthase delta subunit
MAQMKEQLNERDVEIKIMKREKDEFLTSRLELALENKRLKVFHLIINEY